MKYIFIPLIPTLVLVAASEVALVGGAPDPRSAFSDRRSDTEQRVRHGAAKLEKPGGRSRGWHCREWYKRQLQQQEEEEEEEEDGDDEKKTTATSEGTGRNDFPPRRSLHPKKRMPKSKGRMKKQMSGAQEFKKQKTAKGTRHRVFRCPHPPRKGQRPKPRPPYTKVPTFWDSRVPTYVPTGLPTMIPTKVHTIGPTKVPNDVSSYSSPPTKMPDQTSRPSTPGTVRVEADSATAPIPEGEYSYPGEFWEAPLSDALRDFASLGRLQLVLPGGRVLEYEANLAGRDEDNEAASWSGVQSDDGGHASLVRSDYEDESGISTLIAGVLYTSGYEQVLHLTQASETRLLLEIYDTSVFAQASEEHYLLPERKAKEKVPAPMGERFLKDEETTVITLYSFYTTEAVCVAIKSTENCKPTTSERRAFETSYVRTAIKEANEAFLRSGVHIKLSSVISYFPEFRESTDLAEMVDRLRAEKECPRRELGIDLVTLFLGTTGGGRAAGKTDTVNNNLDRNVAFSVVGYKRATLYNYLVHELAHNMGCYHDPATDKGRLHPYAQGYQYLNKYGTIMSYAAPRGQVLLPYFSSPEKAPVLGKTLPLGDSQHDNTRWLNENREAIGKFGEYTCDGKCTKNLKLHNICTASPVPAPRSRPYVSGVFGDPHISTFDILQFECQAAGEFTTLTSLETPRFAIQERFTAVSSNACTQASISTGIVFRDEGLPTVQISIPQVDDRKDSNRIGVCDVDLFVDGSLRSIGVGMNVFTEKVQIHVLGSSRIVILYTESKLEAQLTLQKSNTFGCSFLVQVTLPVTFRPSETLLGLLGTPNGNQADDWVARNGTVLVQPQDESETIFGHSYEYCTTNWCIRQPDESAFSYRPGESFSSISQCDVDYSNELEAAIANASPQLVDICGTSIPCFVDGFCGEISDAQLAFQTQAAIESIQEGALNGKPCVLNEDCTISTVCIRGFCWERKSINGEPCDEGDGLNDCAFSDICGRSLFISGSPFVCCASETGVVVDSEIWCQQPTGASCRANDGRNVDDICLSDYCNDGICEGTLEVGELCVEDDACTSRACGHEFFSPESRLICCAGRIFFSTFLFGERWCSQPPGASCMGPDGTSFDSVCSGDNCINGICVGREQPNGKPCEKAQHCESNQCALARFEANSTLACCASMDVAEYDSNLYCLQQDGASCLDQDDNWVDNICLGGNCISGICGGSSFPDGEICLDFNDCSSSFCGHVNLEPNSPMVCCLFVAFYNSEYWCVQAEGDSCLAPDGIPSHGFCSTLNCQNGVCATKLVEGDPCEVYGQCSSESCGHERFDVNSTTICCDAIWFDSVEFCRQPAGASCLAEDGTSKDQICLSGICTFGICQSGRLSPGDACDSHGDCEFRCGHSAFAPNSPLVCCTDSGSYFYKSESWCRQPDGTSCLNENGSSLRGICTSDYCFAGICESKAEVGEPCPNGNVQCETGMCGHVSFNSTSPFVCCESMQLYFSERYCRLTSGQSCETSQGVSVDNVCESFRCDNGVCV